MKLVNFDGDAVEVNPGGDQGYLIEMIVTSEDGSQATVYLRPEEWAALNGAVHSYQDEYWYSR